MNHHDYTENDMSTKGDFPWLSSDSLRELLILGMDTDPDGGPDPEIESLSLCVSRLLTKRAPTQSHEDAGMSTEQCLLDASQPVSTFSLLKDSFKAAIAGEPPGTRADANKVLYYAAIAAAIVHHGEVITKLGGAEQDDALTYLADSVWMPASLAVLFCCAADTLRRKYPFDGRVA